MFTKYPRDATTILATVPSGHVSLTAPDSLSQNESPFYAEVDPAFCGDARQKSQIRICASRRKPGRPNFTVSPCPLSLIPAAKGGERIRRLFSERGKRQVASAATGGARTRRIPRDNCVWLPFARVDAFAERVFFPSFTLNPSLLILPPLFFARTRVSSSHFGSRPARPDIKESLVRVDLLPPAHKVPA